MTKGIDCIKDVSRIIVRPDSTNEALGFIVATSARSRILSSGMEIHPLASVMPVLDQQKATTVPFDVLVLEDSTLGVWD